MKDSQAHGALLSAKHRGKEYAVLYYRPGQDLEFIEAYDDMQEMLSAYRFWKNLGYARAYTYLLDLWKG